MFHSKIIPATLAGFVAVGAAIGAFAANGTAANDEQQEAAALLNAKTSLVQAITAAEQHTGGKAIDSGVEDQNGKVIAYDIKVIKGNAVQKVLVDLDTGKVLKATTADAEHENGEHEDD